MLVSGTTRPLLGCMWNFRSKYRGLSYATTSMIIHETVPVFLMSLTNLASLYTLYTHGKTRRSVQDAPIIKRVPAERRAAKVCWGELNGGYVDLNKNTVLQVCSETLLDEINISYSCPLICFHSCTLSPVVYFSGDPGSYHAVHRVVGNQHYLYKLLQLQSWLII